MYLKFTYPHSLLSCKAIIVGQYQYPTSSPKLMHLASPCSLIFTPWQRNSCCVSWTYRIWRFLLKAKFKAVSVSVMWLYCLVMSIANLLPHQTDTEEPQAANWCSKLPVDLPRSVVPRKTPNISKQRPLGCFIWLVVSTPWKILVNWDDYSQYMDKYKMFQTTNQSSDFWGVIPTQCLQTTTSPDVGQLEPDIDVARQSIPDI